MKLNRRIGKGGGVTLPASLRRELGIQGGEKLEVICQNDGSILMRRIEATCLFTEVERDLIAYRGRYVSAEAIAEMLAALPDELRHQVIAGASDPEGGDHHEG